MEISPSLILLVEDDPNDVILIRRAFDKARIANPIQLVRDGEEAIAYLAGTPPYDDRRRYPLPMLLLLDLKMPRKSGFEVLAWLRQQPHLRRLPVVVLTSSKDTPDIDRAYDLGANSYLVKPVAFEALIDMVKILGLYWLIYNQKPTLAPEKR